MGKRCSCVDACATHEWEADFASRLANGIAFWIWYVPRDAIRGRRKGWEKRRTLRRVVVMSRLAVVRRHVRPNGHSPRAGVDLELSGRSWR